MKIAGTQPCVDGPTTIVRKVVVRLHASAYAAQGLLILYLAWYVEQT